MKRFVLVAIAAAVTSLAAAAAPGSSMSGYTVSDAVRERRIEAQFVDIPSAQSARDTGTVIGARPHAAGTPGDYALAVYLRGRLREAGISAELVPFTAIVQTPRELVLELAPPADLAAAAPRHGRRHAAFPVALDLRESGTPADPATQAGSIGLPYDTGSGDGDVSAPLVYANRGAEADYAALEHAGVDMHGAVVLVRSGAEIRGRLAQRAQTRGAAGVILYSDPQDDGSARGLTAPDGPWRPAAAVERGWVGDAIHIPVLPVSAGNAQQLLAILRGPAGPPEWTGALPVTYPLARGPGRVHLIVKLNRKAATLWNTIGIVPGVRGDESVVVGAPRDAAVYGVGENGSGVTTIVEVARGLGFLLGGGWRPQRTIVLAGWDGEEIGSAGQREYAAAHRTELLRGCVAYLDAARTVTGPAFAAWSDPALSPLITDVSRAVRDPLAPSAAVYDRWAATAPGISGPGPAFGDVGSPSATLVFRGPFGVRGSSYDTFTYAERVSDPDFVLHRTAAELYGALTLRLADAGGAPYSLGGYAPLLRARIRALNLSAAGGNVVRSALNRFSAAAQRFDRADPATAGDAAQRAIGAVRALDVLARSTPGGPAGAAPDPAGLAAAIGSAASALTPAGSAGRPPRAAEL